MDIAVGCGFLLEVVLVDDVLWDVGYFQLHVFGAVHWCVQIKILDVDRHETCTLCGDDAVEQHFHCHHIGRWSAAIVGVIDAVADDGESYPVWVFFSLAENSPLSVRRLRRAIGQLGCLLS